MTIAKKMIILFTSFIFLFSTINIIESQASETVDSAITGADSFITEGESDKINKKGSDGKWYKENYNTIDQGKLKDTTDFLYNLLLGIGIVVAVIVGLIIGVILMTGSVEEKAKYKELLWPYLISCVVIFGAFGIWKIIVNAFSSI